MENSSGLGSRRLTHGPGRERKAQKPAVLSQKAGSDLHGGLAQAAAGGVSLAHSQLQNEK